MPAIVSIVKFRDTLEQDSEPHYGVLFDNGWILCLCGCKGYLEPEDYEIIEDNLRFPNMDDMLAEYYSLYA